MGLAAIILTLKDSWSFFIIIIVKTNWYRLKKYGRKLINPSWRKY
jgi:hypothetical protein